MFSSGSVTFIISAPIELINNSLTGEMCGSVTQTNLLPRYLHIAASATPILPDDDSIFGTQEEAKTDISSGMIYIKESVMEEACCCANKRASFTIAHEIGHFILHRMLGGVNLARSTSVKKTKIYEDPEWQANTFASEFLMPFEAARNMSIDEIRRTYCVSKDCARVRFEKVRGECLNDEIEQYLQN